MIKLDPKIISKKQADTTLASYEDKLKQIENYKDQLNDLPETKIINMLGERIKELKTDIENDEQNQINFKEEIGNIKIDINAISNLESSISRLKLELDAKKRDYHFLKANIENDAKSLVSMQSNLVEYKEKVLQINFAQERL